MAGPNLPTYTPRFGFGQAFASAYDKHLNRQFEKEILESQQAFQADESEKDRTWRTDERIGGQDWQSDEYRLGRDFDWDKMRSGQLHDFDMQDARFGHDVGMQDRQFSFTGGQNLLNRAHDYSMQDARFGHDIGMQNRRLGHDKTIHDENLKYRQDVHDDTFGLKKDAYDFEKDRTMQGDAVQNALINAYLNEQSADYDWNQSIDQAQKDYAKRWDDRTWLQNWFGKKDLTLDKHPSEMTTMDLQKLGWLRESPVKGNRASILKDALTKNPSAGLTFFDMIQLQEALGDATGNTNSQILELLGGN
tara:strand:+ start:313 stop:1227 length:915 start_codon:yes stop_codon:yes gene_type:complete